MIPGLGQIVQLNKDFVNDVRSRGGKYEKWMRGGEADNFQVLIVDKVDHQRLTYIYKITFENVRTARKHRVSLAQDGKHVIQQLSDEPVFKFQADESDVCLECGVVGEIFKAACVCRCCGKTIWGC